MFSQVSNVCTTSAIGHENDDDDDDVEEVFRPAVLGERFQGERIVTWVEDPTKGITHGAHLLRVHENFESWLGGRIDSPLSSILLLRCKTETRGCDECAEAALRECRAASPELGCIACQAGQRTFCLRLGNQPCLRWDERRINEYETRRKWWIGEAGRGFCPSIPPSRSQMSATVALTSTATTGARSKTETRSSVAEHAKGALSKLGGMVRSLGQPLASSPALGNPGAYHLQRSSGRLSDVVIPSGKINQLGRLTNRPLSSDTPQTPARLQDQLLAPNYQRQVPFTVYQDPGLDTAQERQHFPIQGQVPRNQLQLLGRTPFGSLPKSHSPYTSFQQGVNQRLGSTKIREDFTPCEQPGVRAANALLSFPRSQHHSRGPETEYLTGFGPGQSYLNQGTSPVDNVTGATFAAAQWPDVRQQGGLRERVEVEQPGGDGAVQSRRGVDRMLGLVESQSDTSRLRLGRMGELEDNVQELGQIVRDLIGTSYDNGGGRSQSERMSSPARDAPGNGEVTTPVLDPSLEYQNMRRRGNDILRQQREGLPGGDESPPPPYSTIPSRRSPPPTLNPGTRRRSPGRTSVTTLARERDTRRSPSPSRQRLVSQNHQVGRNNVARNSRQHVAQLIRHERDGRGRLDEREVYLGNHGCNSSRDQHRRQASLSHREYERSPPGDGGASHFHQDRADRRGHSEGGGNHGGEPRDHGGDGGDGHHGGNPHNHGGGSGDDPGDGGGSGDRRSGDGDGRDRSLDNLGLSGAFANLLLDRIRFLEQRGTPAEVPRIRQKPLSLPTPVKEVDGSIRTTSVYRWLRQIAKAVDELGLDRSYTLYQLANESKLPAQWNEIFSGATDLESAFVHLRQRIPPLASCFPELVGCLTGKSATDGTNEAVIERCSEHLSSISDLVALFPNRSINREQLLACLASVGSTQQLQAQMVTTIRQMDQRQQLPSSDPDHLPYLEQLRIWLEAERNIRVDIIASIKVGKIANESVSTVTSFVTKVELPGKVRFQPPRKGKTSRQGSDSNQRAGEKEANKPKPPVKSETKKTNKPEVVKKSMRTCGICNDPSAKSHPPWLCSQLPALRQGRLARPPSLCQRCCSWVKTDSPHTQTCGEKSFTDKNGVDKRISWQCIIHGSVHYLLCSKCGPGTPTKPVAFDISPVIPSLVAPIMAINSQISQGKAFPKVVFMSELLKIRSRTGEEISVVCYYDSMGGFNFTNQIPGEYNHGKPSDQSLPFNLSTLHGTEEYRLPVATVQVARHGQWESVEFMITPLPTIPCVELPQSLLNTCKIEHLTPSQCEDTPVKLILGAQESNLFPTSVPTHKALLSRHPGLRTWRSRMSGRLLLSGSLTDPGQATGNLVPSLVSQCDSARETRKKGSKPHRDPTNRS